MAQEVDKAGPVTEQTLREILGDAFSIGHQTTQDVITWSRVKECLITDGFVDKQSLNQLVSLFTSAPVVSPFSSPRQDSNFIKVIKDILKALLAKYNKASTIFKQFTRRNKSFV